MLVVKLDSSICLVGLECGQPNNNPPDQVTTEPFKSGNLLMN